MGFTILYKKPITLFNIVIVFCILTDRLFSYLINFGLRPYFSESLSDTLKNEVDFSVIMFDESHNSVLEKKQMDIHLRLILWDTSTNMAVSRYSDSIGT